MHARRAWLIAVVLLGGACREFEQKPGGCETHLDCPKSSCNMDTKFCLPLDAGVDTSLDAATDAPVAGETSADDVAGGGDGAIDTGGPVDVPVEMPLPCHGDDECKEVGRPACELGICVPCTDSFCMQQMPMTPVCDCVGKRCVECTAASHAQCKDGKPVCNDKSDCVQCTSTQLGQCTNKTTVCDEMYACVECTTAQHAGCVGVTPICVGKMCHGCQNNGDCMAMVPAKTPICNSDGSCVECLAENDCKNIPGKTHCDTQAKRCVECNDSRQCDAAKPVCTGHTCAPCQRDKECELTPGELPGLCWLSGPSKGRCVTDNEVVYARADNCSSVGSQLMPRCSPQFAVDQAISDKKPIVILLGSVTALDAFVVKDLGTDLWIAGKAGAKILPRVDLGTGAKLPGITLSNARLTVQDIEIGGGQAEGITTTGGSLTVKRSYIHENTRSGIVTDGTNFDIQNTVVVLNGPGTYAGVVLGLSTGSPTTFTNNTVMRNGFGGVTCRQTYNIVGSIIARNGTAQLAANCIAADSCTTMCTNAADTADPKLDETMGRYQLTSATPMVCKDVLTVAPDTDRKGTLRPKNGNSDCGADEF